MDILRTVILNPKQLYFYLYITSSNIIYFYPPRRKFHSLPISFFSFPKRREIEADLEDKAKVE